MIPRKIGETTERSLMSKTKEPVDHAGPLLPPRTWSPNSSSRNQMNVKVETLTIVNKNLLTVQKKKSTMSPDVMVDLCQVLTTTLLITDFLKPRTTSTLAKKEDAEEILHLDSIFLFTLGIQLTMIQKVRTWLVLSANYLQFLLP